MGDFEPFAAHLEEAGFGTRRDAGRIFGCQTGYWLLQGSGWWAVEVSASAAYVGTVGAFLRDGYPGEVEIGWNTFRAFRGQGFAREAAAEAVRYALEVRREPRVSALIRPQNLASLRVASALGMQHEVDLDLWGEAVGRYGLAR